MYVSFGNLTASVLLLEPARPFNYPSRQSRRRIKTDAPSEREFLFSSPRFFPTLLRIATLRVTPPVTPRVTGSNFRPCVVIVPHAAGSPSRRTRCARPSLETKAREGKKKRGKAVSVTRGPCTCGTTLADLERGARRVIRNHARKISRDISDRERFYPRLEADRAPGSLEFSRSARVFEFSPAEDRGG